MPIATDIPATLQAWARVASPAAWHTAVARWCIAGGGSVPAACRAAARRLSPAERGRLAMRRLRRLDAEARALLAQAQRGASAGDRLRDRLAAALAPSAPTGVTIAVARPGELPDCMAWRHRGRVRAYARMSARWAVPAAAGRVPIAVGGAVIVDGWPDGDGWRVWAVAPAPASPRLACRLARAGDGWALHRIA